MLRTTQITVVMTGGIVVLALILALVSMASAGSALAQTTPAPDQLRGVIETLSAQGSGFSIEFAQPLTSNERRRDFTNEPLRVGDNYFCFGEPWNNGLRWHCTPFTNIISVTFLE